MKNITKKVLRTSTTETRARLIYFLDGSGGGRTVLESRIDIIEEEIKILKQTIIRNTPSTSAPMDSQFFHENSLVENANEQVCNTNARMTYISVKVKLVLQETQKITQNKIDNLLRKVNFEEFPHEEV